MVERRFSYHHSVAPMMWVLVAAACGELVVVHLLIVLFWRPIFALIASVISLGGVVWMVAAIASMKRLPVVLDDRSLIMRVGTLKAITVPIAFVAGLRSDWNAASLKDRSTLRLSLIAYPNVVVDLVGPRPGRRAITAIAHRLDDPAAFCAAVMLARGRHEQR